MKCKNGNIFAYLFLVAVLVMQLILCSPILPGTVAESKPDLTTAFDENKGTESNPYLITSVADFNTLASWVNSGGQTSYYYKLTTNLDFGKSGGDKGSFTMIGTGVNHFNGNFDGDGHIIRNFALTGNETDLGVFAYSNGIIENLKIDSGSITLSTRGLSAGGFVGSMYGGAQIINCANLGVTVTASSSAGGSSIGGIIGCCGTTATGATISQCYNLADINNYGEGNGTTTAGGIAGEANVPISECYNKGKIVSGALTLSIWAGSVSYSSGTDSSYAGGITGKTSKTINNCFNQGDVTANAKKNESGSETGVAIDPVGQSRNLGQSVSTVICSNGKSANGFKESYNALSWIDIGAYRSSISCNAYAAGLSYEGTIRNSYNTGDVKGGFFCQIGDFFYKIYKQNSSNPIFEKNLGSFITHLSFYVKNNNDSSNVISNGAEMHNDLYNDIKEKYLRDVYFNEESIQGDWKEGGVDWRVNFAWTWEYKSGRSLNMNGKMTFYRNTHLGWFTWDYLEVTNFKPEVSLKITQMDIFNIQGRPAPWGNFELPVSVGNSGMTSITLSAINGDGAFAESDIINGGYPHLKCFYWQDDTANFA